VSFLTKRLGPYPLNGREEVSHYSAAVSWHRGDAPFVDQRYSRAHLWKFDGGAVVRASSSPGVVPLPYSDPSAVDPEEAFVAALASCHMLWFLSIAAKNGFCVQAYRDAAVGTMAANSRGTLCMTVVNLRPHTVFTAAKMPSLQAVREMHEEAHQQCYLANSVTTVVTTEPTFELA
jgi:organic hydroperoxide reductase OsmC/OhrA